MIRNSHAREKRSIKPLAYALLIFATLGLTIANSTLAQLGLEQNYVIVVSVALVVASLLLSRQFWLVLAVVIGVLTVNQPDAFLQQYHLDRDVILAFVCALILVPTVYRLLVRMN